MYSKFDFSDASRKAPLLQKLSKKQLLQKVGLVVVIVVVFVVVAAVVFGRSSDTSLTHIHIV